MSVPQHTLSLYQRPAQGVGFINRWEILNYTHTIAAQGGFDTANCDIAVRSQTEGQDFLNNYLGCFVRFYADNPVEPIWEGLINRITFNSGGVSYTISLDELANRVSVIYTGATNVAAQTTIADNTTSQSIYGIRQDQIEFGVDPSAGTHRTSLRDTILAQRAFPQTSITQGGGDTNLVTLECIGIYQTLQWEKRFTITSTASTAINTRMSAVIALLGNGTTFFDNTDTSQINANAITTPNQSRGQTYWDEFLKMAEGGDGTNYWICGVNPTNLSTGLRNFYYKRSNVAVQYTARQSDGLRIRNVYGRLVEPWTVRPDCSIQVTDVLVGYNSSVTTDPRITYVFSIQYDANTQKVQYFGADNTTAQAAYMLRRGFKPVGKAFGAVLRTIST